MIHFSFFSLNYFSSPFLTTRPKFTRIAEGSCTTPVLLVFQWTGGEKISNLQYITCRKHETSNRSKSWWFTTGATTSQKTSTTIFSRVSNSGHPSKTSRISLLKTLRWETTFVIHTRNSFATLELNMYPVLWTTNWDPFTCGSKS